MRRYYQVEKIALSLENLAAVKKFNPDGPGL
jgi:hypothetical protein